MIPAIIVEDEFLVRLGLKTAVDWESEGFAIVGEASNGEEGIALYQKHRPRLILTDIRMPKKDGITLMREIRRQDREVRFIVLTAYNEFSYAKDSIDVGVEAYLLKGSILRDELSETLQKIRGRLAGTLPSNDGEPTKTDGFVLDGELSKRQTLRDLALPAELAEPLFLCCARFSGKRARALCQSLAALGLRVLSERQWSHFHLQNEECFYVVLSGAAAARAAMQALAEATQRYLSRGLYCGISAPASRTDPLHLLVQQARAACNQNIFRQDAGAVQEYALPAFTRSKKAGAGLSELERALLDCDAGRCVRQLRSLREELLESGSIKLLFRTLYRLSMILAQYDESLLENEVYDSLLRLDRLDDIFRELERLYAEMCAKLTSLVPQGSLHVEKARLYIRDNLCKGIKLRDVSAHVHLTPNYLGQLFFNETGMYLTDFIVNERIVLACQLLLENSLAISQVAERVGVPDQQYFSKLFRKKTGISPKEYAQRYNRANDSNVIR